VLGWLTRANDTYKRKRFGDYKSYAPVDDVLSEQYDLWQALVSKQIGYRKEKQNRTAHNLTATSRAFSNCKWDAPKEIVGSPFKELGVSRDIVAFGLDFGTKAKVLPGMQDVPLLFRKKVK